MDKNLSDVETASLLISVLNERFIDLLDPQFKSDKFVIGEVAAYSDCYDMIGAWSEAAKFDYKPQYLSARNKL